MNQTLKIHPITTADGSSSLFHSGLNETYHSRHGAVQETEHVFIKMGLDFVYKNNPNERPIKILELGFGTGLNALATILYTEKQNISIYYESWETHPLPEDTLAQLNYSQHYPHPKAATYFQNLHALPWETKQDVHSQFTLIKRADSIENISVKDCFHLIYFDAFGYGVQPDLWTEGVFTKMYEALQSGGVLVTYASKGIVHRTLIKVGFQVEKLPGPPGKREMLRAIKR